MTVAQSPAAVPTLPPLPAPDRTALIESILEAAPTAFALLDPTGAIRLDNAAYRRLSVELEVPELAGTLLDGLLAGWRERLAADPGRCAFPGREASIDRAGQRSRWLSVTARAIDLADRGSGGEPAPDSGSDRDVGGDHAPSSEGRGDFANSNAGGGRDTGVDHAPCSENGRAARPGGGWRGLLLAIADVTGLREEQERARAAALQAALAEEERTAAIREGLSAALFRFAEPMNVMASAIAVLQRRDPGAADILRQALTASQEHLETLRQVIPQSPHEIVIGLNINAILRDVLEVSTPRLLAAGIVVDWRPAVTLPPLLGRPLQLRMLFKALVDNAIEAMDVKGWQRRELALTSAVNQDRILVSVLDTGPGIPPDWRLRAFEPFFTAKPGRGRHIGTGLSRAQQVVADHGGIIDLDDSPSGGCAVIVEFRVGGEPL